MMCKSSLKSMVESRYKKIFQMNDKWTLVAQTSRNQRIEEFYNLKNYKLHEYGMLKSSRIKIERNQVCQS